MKIKAKIWSTNGRLVLACFYWCGTQVYANEYARNDYARLKPDKVGNVFFNWLRPCSTMNCFAEACLFHTEELQCNLFTHAATTIMESSLTKKYFLQNRRLVNLDIWFGIIICVLSLLLMLVSLWTPHQESICKTKSDSITIVASI